MNNRLIIIGLSLLVTLQVHPIRAQKPDRATCDRISECVTRIIDREVVGASTKVETSTVRGRRLRLNFSIGLANYPFREERVAALYDSVRSCLPKKLAKQQLEIYTDGHLIEELIPLSERTTFDRRKIRTFTNTSRYPLVRPLEPLHTPTRGLQNRHIALWQSHGHYFDQAANRWRWQRTAQWMTREDLFTLSYVLPYLVPMLESAGANVLLPRERDFSSWEGIADGDMQPSGYCEHNGSQAWTDGGVGFANPKASYVEGENPFLMGRCRMVQSVMNPNKASRAEWRIPIPERGEYALYVSYRSFPKSSREARYTVHHAGGETTLAVNQQMGGGSWIYLGTFDFEAGEEGALVTLTNLSERAGDVVVADAVRIGGGMGNIARTPCDSLRQSGLSYHETLSGLPRYMEGSRYWLQWAGFGPEVYAPKQGKDDYKEDYMSRAHWVNALMGGSERLRDSVGLGIPIDLSLAFHTDAGMTDNDDIIGTLGIFYTKENKGEFEGSVSRYRSRDLTDVVMTRIVEDIRSLWEPKWRRRGLWNRAYYEARIPAVPTMLLELLSHQNFADMRYGHDPRFKFTVARAIYKGILQHIATQYGYDYVVEPLPVRGFAMHLSDDKSLELQWQPRIDSLEPTATPTAYLLYTAIDERGFDNGVRIENPSLKLQLEPGHHYRFRVTAINDGGESFPSETLAAYLHPASKGEVLIVNGFTRTSAAPSFRTEQEAGFATLPDGGVSYLRDVGYIGPQTIYDRSRWNHKDPEQATGGSLHDQEGVIRAGNSFDYPIRHGEAIAAAGYSYLSTSLEAFEAGRFDYSAYAAIDLLLGKQRATTRSRGYAGWDFKSFSPELQTQLRSASEAGTGLLVSGCYPASDLWQSECSTNQDRRFAREVLHYEFASLSPLSRNLVRGIAPELNIGSCRLNLAGDATHYALESVDALWAVGENAFPIARYAADNQVAAVAYQGDRYRSVVLAFPFESLMDKAERQRVMATLLTFLTDKKQ